MAAIQFTERRTASRLSIESLTLARAASAAISAPSIPTGRPWRWRIDGPVLGLYVDHVDPPGVDDARVMTVNCGIVLHHARTALAADRVAADIRYLPDPNDPDLIATITHAGMSDAGAGEGRLFRAIAARKADSRRLAATAVPPDALDRLLTAGRLPGVSVRVENEPGGAGHVLGVHPEDDGPELLLSAGEATSAILLTANVQGLATDLGRGRAGAAASIRIGVPVSRIRMS